jgi:hypothetical protein
MLPLFSFVNGEFVVVASDRSSSKWTSTQRQCTIPATKALSPASRKAVTFAPEVSGILHLHINNFSNKEAEASWYTKDEFNLIRADAKFAATLLTKGLLTHDSDKYCKRGLEFRTPEGAIRRIKNKNAAREAVLDEQQFFQEEKISYYHPDNVDYLAEVYSSYSRHCQKAAHELALQDEKDAHMILAEF